MAKRKPAKVAQRVDLRLGAKHARWLSRLCDEWQAPPTVVLRMLIANEALVIATAKARRQQ